MVIHGKGQDVNQGICCAFLIEVSLGFSGLGGFEVGAMGLQDSVEELETMDPTLLVQVELVYEESVKGIHAMFIQHLGL